MNRISYIIAGWLNVLYSMLETALQLVSAYILTPVLNLVHLILTGVSQLINTYILSPIIQSVRYIFVSLWSYVIVPCYQFIAPPLIQGARVIIDSVVQWIITPLYHELSFCLSRSLSAVTYVLTAFQSWIIHPLSNALWQWLILPLFNALDFCATAFIQAIQTLFSSVILPIRDWIIIPLTDLVIAAFIRIWEWIITPLYTWILVPFVQTVWEWMIIPLYNGASYLLYAFDQWILVPFAKTAWKYLISPAVSCIQYLWRVLRLLFTWKNITDLLLLMVGIILHPFIGLHLAIVTPALSNPFFYRGLLAALIIFPISFWKIYDQRKTVQDPKLRAIYAVKVAGAAIYATLSVATISNYNQISKLARPSL